MRKRRWKKILQKSREENNVKQNNKTMWCCSHSENFEDIILHKFFMWWSNLNNTCMYACVLREVGVMWNICTIFSMCVSMLSVCMCVCVHVSEKKKGREREAIIHLQILSGYPSYHANYSAHNILNLSYSSVMCTSLIYPIKTLISQYYFDWYPFSFTFIYRRPTWTLCMTLSHNEALARKPLWLSGDGTRLRPNLTFTSPVLTKETRRNILQSEHFPTLQTNCRTVCPFLWESKIHRNLVRKTWKPTCFQTEQEKKMTKTVCMWQIDFFLKAQWACCCSMNIHALYKIVFVIIVIN